MYVVGKISFIEEAYTTQYGNGTFNISDDGTTDGAQFKAYRVYYLGNQKFKSGDTQIKVGDDVIVYGKVMNKQGKGPQFSQGEAFLYELNGVNKGGVDAGSGEDGEEVPDENLEPAGENNIAGLVAKIDKAATQSAPTAIADFALTGATVTYVNGSSAYIEDKSGAVLLYKSGHGLKAGPVIIVTACLSSLPWTVSLLRPARLLSLPR